jgi:hypothetical protein
MLDEKDEDGEDDEKDEDDKDDEDLGVDLSDINEDHKRFYYRTIDLFDLDRLK